MNCIKDPVDLKNVFEINEYSNVLSFGLPKWMDNFLYNIGGNCEVFSGLRCKKSFDFCLWVIPNRPLFERKLMSIAKRLEKNARLIMLVFNDEKKCNIFNPYMATDLLDKVNLRIDNCSSVYFQFEGRCLEFSVFYCEFNKVKDLGAKEAPETDASSVKKYIELLLVERLQSKPETYYIYRNLSNARKQRFFDYISQAKRYDAIERRISSVLDQVDGYYKLEKKKA